MGHGVLTDACLNQRVAVWRGFGTLLGANHATRATHVFDDERLLEDLAKLLSHQTPHHVTGATGRERHDDLDRLAGVV